MVISCNMFIIRQYWHFGAEEGPLSHTHEGRTSSVNHSLTVSSMLNMVYIYIYIYIYIIGLVCPVVSMAASKSLTHHRRL